MDEMVETSEWAREMQLHTFGRIDRKVTFKGSLKEEKKCAL
jgi:hypothetical protein